MDTTPYMAVPYKDRGRDMSGANCYGLVWLIYARELGIILPKYDDKSAEKTPKDELQELVENEANLYRQVKIPQAFDMVLIRTGGAYHIGCMLDADYMIHLATGCNRSEEP